MDTWPERSDALVPNFRPRVRSARREAVSDHATPAMRRRGQRGRPAPRGVTWRVVLETCSQAHVLVACGKKKKGLQGLHHRHLLLLHAIELGPQRLAPQRELPRLRRLLAQLRVDPLGPLHAAQHQPLPEQSVRAERRLALPAQRAAAPPRAVAIAVVPAGRQRQPNGGPKACALPCDRAWLRLASQEDRTSVLCRHGPDGRTGVCAPARRARKPHATVGGPVLAAALAAAFEQRVPPPEAPGRRIAGSQGGAKQSARSASGDRVSRARRARDATACPPTLAGDAGAPARAWREGSDTQARRQRGQTTRGG